MLASSSDEEGPSQRPAKRTLASSDEDKKLDSSDEEQQVDKKPKLDSGPVFSNFQKKIFLKNFEFFLKFFLKDFEFF